MRLRTLYIGFSRQCRIQQNTRPKLSGIRTYYENVIVKNVYQKLSARNACKELNFFKILSKTILNYYSCLEFVLNFFPIILRVSIGNMIR